MLGWWAGRKEEPEEQVLKNTNDFLTEHFNNLLKQKNILKNLLEKCNVLSKLRNINDILNGADYKCEDIIAWLSNNTRSIFNEKLVKPNSGLTEFITATTLNFSNYHFTTKNVQNIANYLRNNKTIEQVYLDNCGINDEQVKILAEVFRLNKKITKLSLANNKKITNVGIKTLLKIKDYNNQLTELKISPKFVDIRDFQIIPDDLDIFNDSLDKYLKETELKNIDGEIENRNLQPLTKFHYLERPMIKNGNELLKLIAESHNEITKTGDIKKLIAMVGMNGVGTTTLSCFLGGQKLEEDEDRSLYAKEPEYDEKIHHEADNGYKRVNNFFISDDEGGINIIACPGIHNKEIDSIQTILNSYIYWQILELAEKVRFSVVIRDNSVNDVIDNTYKQFTNIFRDGTGQLTPEIKKQLEDALSYIISVADYKTEEEKNTKIKEEKSKLSKLLKSNNLDEGQKFIITQLEKSINLFKKPSGKSFLETLDTKDFFIVIDALSLLIRTIANNEIQEEREKIFSYIEAIFQSQTLEEKNANIALIDEQKRNILEIFTSSKDKGDALLNSVSDVGCIITEEQKNLTNIALKLELQDILSKKTLYEPLVIEQVKKLMPLCVKPFSDTLNIQHLSKGKWATIKEIYIKPSKSKASSPILPRTLSYQVNENILTLGKIITNFLQINKHNIISPFISSDKLDLRWPLDSDIFSKNYSLIQPYLPKEIYNKSSVQKTEKSFFHALKEIEELKEAYIKYSDDHLNMIASFLETIRKFYKAENIGQTNHFQGILGNYIYFLNQQWKALSFCKKLYPQSKDFEPLKDVIKEAKKILIEENLLDKAILDIQLQNKEKIEYYIEALKWLGKFTGKQSELVAVINEIKANAHYYLGMIYENSNLELIWFKAIREYTNALEIDKNFNFNYDYGNEQITFKGICEKIGNLFLNLGRFYKSKNENGTVIKLLQEAIKYFKISLSIVPVEKCSFILREIFNVPKDKKEQKHYLSLEKDLYISLAEFLFKLNLIPQAAFEYYRAASISNLQEEQKLLLKIQEVYDTKMKENTAFIRSMLDKGRMEDLSIVAKEANRTKFLSDTHIIIDDFVPPSKPQADQQVNNQQEIVRYQTKQQHNNKPEAPQAHNELLLGHDEERQAIVQQHNTQLNDRQLLDEQQLMMQVEWGLQAAGIQNPSEQQAKDKKEINKQNDIQHRQSQPTANTPLYTIENIQKPGYWYTVDDIKNILEANIDKNKFSIVTHVDLAKPEQVRDALREGVYEDLYKKGKVVLMSINTGHAHWVSMKISKDSNTGEIIFTYNNPLGTMLDNDSDLVRLITEICPNVAIIDLGTRQQDNTWDCGAFVCDNLIKLSENLPILSTEQSIGQGLNLRNSQAESLKQNLINPQPQILQQHYYVNGDSSSDEEDEDNNGSDNEKKYPPYGGNDEVDELGDAFQTND